MIFNRRWNTLRNQIFAAFLSTMLLVLVIAEMSAYRSLAGVTRKEAKEKIEQTALQAVARTDALYRQLQSETQQIATDPLVQQLLLSVKQGSPVTYRERQKLEDVINTYLTYSEGLIAVGIYTNQLRRIYPLSDGHLTDIIDWKWIRRADRLAGRLFWIGDPPPPDDAYLAVRVIRLMNHEFAPAGYLLARVKKTYFTLTTEEESGNLKMLLLDQKGKVVFRNFPKQITIKRILQSATDRIQIQDIPYIVIRETSEVTGWKLYILAPAKMIGESLDILKMSLFLSGIVGFFISLVFSYLLSTLITRPVERLIRAMRRGKSGRYEPIVPSASTSEMQALTETYNDWVHHTNHLIRTVYEKELHRSRSELKALQAQINPHFLYNTLDSLYWSLEEKGEDQLAERIVEMSEFFRYTISDPKQSDWVKFHVELEHIRRYLKIMRMRYGTRLKWQLNIDLQITDVNIPKLLLQPLVENAVIHGIGPLEKGGTVIVTARQAKNKKSIHVFIRDDGKGMTPEKLQQVRRALLHTETVKQNGLAMYNVRRRLDLYYGKGRGKLKICSLPAKGTLVFVSIPQTKGEEFDERAENDSCR